MEKSSEIRLDYLDYARALGIMLIVMQHAFQYFYVYNETVSYIKAFHVTIFFVISGYLTGVRDGKDYRMGELMIARAKGLLIPYVVFSLINTFLKFTVLGIQGGLTAEIIKQEMLELFVTGNGTVWFLTTLFGVEVLFFQGKIRQYFLCFDRNYSGQYPVFYTAENFTSRNFVKKNNGRLCLFCMGIFSCPVFIKQIKI